MTTIDSLIQRINSTSDKPCYPDRISNLQKRGFVTSLIEHGIAESMATLRKGTKSFVVYGEPQSGKTEFMIALTCKLLDEGYETIFIVMNDNTELEEQNFDRFHSASELNPAPIQASQLKSLDDKNLKQRKRRIIFCRKNAHNLRKVIEASRFMKKRIIIDDEADYASPNSKISKKDPEVSKINELVGELAKFDEEGVYIGVTATPGRLDLNNTFLNESKDWVFLESHSQYKGRSFFFPVTEDDTQRSDYRLVKLPDESDNPKLLEDAILRFLLRTALLNSAGSEHSPYSMLIHTAGKTLDHIEDKKIIDRTISRIQDQNNKHFRKMIERMKGMEAQIDFSGHATTIDDLIVFVVKNISKSQVLIINHQNDKTNVMKASKPKSLFTFAIGGNIVSRGLTFEMLLTFFFSRNVKGKLQQNTYIQRARMFGHRPYSKHFELCVPGTLFQDWADCFQNHELSLMLAKAGQYQHIHGKKDSPADYGAIDRENVIISRGERPLGEKFKLNSEIENVLKDQSLPAMSRIRLLQERSLIPDNAVHEAAIQFINYTTKSPDEISMVLKSPVKGETELQITDINAFKDADEEDIARKRSGIIAAITHKRPAFFGKKHFIAPIKNYKGEARFYYKSELGKTILENTKTR